LTVPIDYIVTQLRADGNLVRDEDLARVFRQHITPSGSYFHSPRNRTPAAEPVLA
jgi:hypothetical protein